MILEAILTKRASAGTDWLGTGISALPNVVAGVPGYIHGMVSDIDKDEIKKMDENQMLSLAPGVGPSRLARRMRAVDRAAGMENGTAHRNYGSLVNPLLLGLLGGGAGAALGAYYNYKKGPDVWKDKEGKEHTTDRKWERILHGAGIGAGVGVGTSLLADLIASDVAMHTDTRSIQDWKNLAKKPMHTASQYLVPGKAVYDAWKALGTSNQLA